MTKKTFTVICLFISFLAEAQVKQTIRVKSGEDLSTVLSTYGVYRYPEFIDGTVLFRDGTTTKAKMNFNVFLNDMLFIDNKGDTLSIDHVELIDSLKLDTNVFYYDKGYFQVVADYSDTKLVMQEKLNYENVKKGAYGLPTAGGSITNYSTFSVGNDPAKKLVVNQDIIIKKEDLFLLIYKKYRSIRANEKGFLTAFPYLKDAIENFIHANHINFNKQADLEKMVKFCAQNSK